LLLFIISSFSYLITVSPESVVVPIVSCIFGFPLLALLVICCLRRRAKLARERDRQMNYGLQDHAVSLVRFSPIHRLSESFSDASKASVDTRALLCSSPSRLPFVPLVLLEFDPQNY